MKKKKFTNSVRKYIRKEKARIRRNVFDFEKQKEAIEKMYQNLSSKLVSDKSASAINNGLSKKEVKEKKKNNKEKKEKKTKKESKEKKGKKEGEQNK